MFGCLRRAGCLALLLVAVIAGWLTRDLWWERATGRPTATATIKWEAVSSAGGTAARARVRRLSDTRGQAFVALTPAELGSIVLSQLTGRQAASLGDMRAAVLDERLLVSATADLSAFRKGSGALGPIGGLLRSRQEVTIGGIPSVASPGVGVFIVETMRIGDVEVPRPLIGRLLDRIQSVARDSGAAVGSTAIRFQLPAYIGDIRLADGRVTLYKRTS